MHYLTDSLKEALPGSPRSDGIAWSVWFGEMHRVFLEGAYRLEREYKVVHYVEDDKDIFLEWLGSLRDVKGRIAVLRRVDRMRDGNFGVHHFCRDGVWELVVDYGPGYRVYYSMTDNVLVLLLCAGSKRTQDNDIERAVAYLRRYGEACPS